MIHLYVHGRGRGHATRCLAIARALDAAGRRFRAFVGPDGVALFSSAYPCTPIASLPPTPGPATLRLASRVRDAVRAARADDATVIVSDGDLPGLSAASLLRRPGIAVGHGLVFSGCERPDALPATPWLRERAKAAVSSAGAQRCIAVNFVPLQPRTPRTIVARPALDPRLHRVDAPDRVLCYFRDGAPEVLRRLVELGITPLVFGPTRPDVDGIEFEPQDRVRFIEGLARARVVVSSAGSQLISECVGLGIPILALHRHDDDEQRLNAAMVREHRLGDGCSFTALTPARLQRFIDAPPAGTASNDDLPDVATAVMDAIDTALLSRGR